MGYTGNVFGHRVRRFVPVAEQAVVFVDSAVTAWKVTVIGSHSHGHGHPPLPATPIATPCSSIQC